MQLAVAALAGDIAREVLGARVRVVGKAAERVHQFGDGGFDAHVAARQRAGVAQRHAVLIERQVDRAGVRLGVSTHDEGELSRALALQPDYVALGPIYPTLLKAMPWPPQGLERITQWKRRIGAIPLVAVGGLTLERLPGVFAAGADVAAVVTDIVRHLNPEARVREWLSAARAA